MSRIGKLPVAVPSGVKAAVAGNVISIEGPRWKLTHTLGRGVRAVLKDNHIHFAIDTDDGDKAYKQVNANWGTARAITANMIKGVTAGWKRSLEMNGVGFNANLKGDTLVVAAGYSHEVKVKVPAGLKVSVNKNIIELECSDRNMLGVMASKLRSIRKPEPYLGKGIRYSEEKIRRKAGKAGKK